ncbi:sensor domain-containing diguanylate cyclase [Phreatobacter cathodiphilus]|uniref:diguanylate cyclase n=1 Tax=Phreatobacter cathodiphilus TaxID=1868589 RepID=A0A2S0NE45_9HYPH|nr:diguanylate cyclase [Phreatobacter cathodiphilus]
MRGLFVYAADGSWVATSEKVDIQGLNNADRDYFRHHRATPDRTPFLGPPIRSRSGGQWILTVSRRVDGPDGAFAGVVLATLDVDYFVRGFAKFDVGSAGSLSLLSSTGVLVARYPFDDNVIGRDFNGSPFMRHAANNHSGTVHFRSVLDGVERISSYHKSERLPLLMLIARGKDEVLAPWRSEASWRMNMVFGLTLLIAGLGALMLRELASRQRLLRVISCQEADFRLLAEASSDMVTRIGFDGRLTYVSPSSLRILGWGPDELIGGQALAGLHREDRNAVETVVEQMRKGERLEALIAYRTRHRTSGTVWLESSLSVTRDPETGRIDGVVAVSRDVTEHKQLEGHLSRLATLDSLTGLANRRFLDDRAERELVLARQHGRPLAMLLIDADHFKAFNDTYGHQAGDHCLQQIAAVIQAHAARPGDLAARYGGEEFALLLADTNEEGAGTVAERIRTSVEALAIPHMGNAAHRVVTISAGGACVIPQASGATVGELVRAADRNLYISKAEGRNRSTVSACISLTGYPPLLIPSPAMQTPIIPALGPAQVAERHS